MHVLIVHAHPEPQSFNIGFTGQACATLTELGHTVEVSDLYAMKFKAVADADDYAVREDPTTCASIASKPMRTGRARSMPTSRPNRTSSRAPNCDSAIPDVVVLDAGHPQGLG